MSGVEAHRVPDHVKRLFPIQELVHDDRLVLERLVVLEEAAELRDPVRRQLADRGVVDVLRIVGVDGEDLVVLLALIAHLHDADRAGAQDRQRNDLLLAEHEDVQGIVVLAVRLRDEPVVGRIVDGGEEHPVDADQPACLVELVLDLRPPRDLDDDREKVRRLAAEGDVVPGMHRRSF